MSATSYDGATGEWRGKLRDRMLFALPAESGMRPGEALGMRINDFVMGCGGTPYIDVVPRLDNLSRRVASRSAPTWNSCSPSRPIHVDALRGTWPFVASRFKADGSLVTFTREEHNGMQLFDCADPFPAQRLLPAAAVVEVRQRQCLPDLRCLRHRRTGALSVVTRCKSEAKVKAAIKRLVRKGVPVTFWAVSVRAPGPAAAYRAASPAVHVAAGGRCRRGR
ncbi:hypothetical protein ABZ260_35755 [Streptosporangium sp. NPDC006013]|uniref:hypothetical protein n=1 Tax=Streptosporangium sp. NPDC006013 TaxID=3155596 RepID=UPI0033BF544A